MKMLFSFNTDPSRAHRTINLPRIPAQHEGVARARHIGPIAVEVGNQSLEVLALHRALQ
jgi:hypothetical protein